MHRVLRLFDFGRSNRLRYAGGAWPGTPPATILSDCQNAVNGGDDACVISKYMLMY